MAWRIYFSFLLQILATVALSSATDEIICSPLDNCKDETPGKSVLDPENCHNYYVCISTSEGVMPSDNPLPCPSKQYFDVDESGCVKEEQPCANPCAHRECTTACNPGEFSLVPYPGDCRKYFVCVPGNDPAIAECPSDTPYFDGSKCTVDRYSCCDICTPYCEKENTETADPYDCTRYYLCLADKTIPTEQQHYSCGEGMHYDSVREHCVVYEEGEEPCKSVCTNTTLSLH